MKRNAVGHMFQLFCCKVAQQMHQLVGIHTSIMIMVKNEMTQCFEACMLVLDMGNFKPLASEAFESTCKHL